MVANSSLARASRTFRRDYTWAQTQQLTAVCARWLEQHQIPILEIITLADCMPIVRVVNGTHCRPLNIIWSTTDTDECGSTWQLNQAIVHGCIVEWRYRRKNGQAH